MEHPISLIKMEAEEAVIAAQEEQCVSSQGGHLAVSEVLLIAGADAKAKDVFTLTPLHWASQGGHFDIVWVLLNHGTKDGDQLTPLHAASQVQHLDVARVLLEHCVKAGAHNKDRWMPLHRTLEGSHIDVVRLLLDHIADARAPDVDRWTLLHRSSMS